MTKTGDQLLALARAGASLEVSGKTADQYIAIARALTGDATLTVLDGSAKTGDQLLEIVRANPTKVIIRSI